MVFRGMVSRISSPNNGTIIVFYQGTQSGPTNMFLLTNGLKTFSRPAGSIG